MPGGGKVHEYFYNAFDTLWNGGLGDELLRLKLQYPDFELWVTGHSLGAAIASLFAEMAVYKVCHNEKKELSRNSGPVSE